MVATNGKVRPACMKTKGMNVFRFCKCMDNASTGLQSWHFATSPPSLHTPSHRQRERERERERGKIVRKMGDKKTLAMARKELEEMYVGVADDSVNLSFQDLAQVMHKKKLSPSSTMAPISESTPSPEIPPATLAKLPSLDFNRAILQASLNTTPHHLHHHHQIDHHDHTPPPPHHLHHHQHHHTNHHGPGFRPSPAMDQRSFMSDDMSYVSSMSTPVAYGGGGGGGRRRRPGTPHSNVCTVCSTYIYIFRHRCLVCGRVYCRQCVAIGMGEMAEGRKCKDCLGRRFSQRYIKKAGNVGCCFGYPSTVKQQELKWAEKGPRTGGADAQGHRSMVAPTSRSPRPPPIPTGHHSNPPSFIATSPYNNHHHFAPL